MCGIIGILGAQPAAPLILNGLKRLEYRGYDSAGIATLANGQIDTRRAVGKLGALAEVLEKFNSALSKTKFIVGQNLGFDINIMGCEFYRLGVESPMVSMPILDTCTEVTASLLKLPGVRQLTDEIFRLPVEIKNSNSLK